MSTTVTGATGPSPSSTDFSSLTSEIPRDWIGLENLFDAEPADELWLRSELRRVEEQECRDAKRRVAALERFVKKIEENYVLEVELNTAGD